MGKLDAAAADVVVNGLEGVALDWDAVNWRAVEDDVRRLRQRIFTASKAGDLKNSTFAVLGGGSAVCVTRRVAWECVILG